ncbi:hypothetical protein Tco_1088833 [Tanacetum coccineum]
MTTEATTLKTVVSKSKTLAAFHQRITNLEKDVKDLKTSAQAEETVFEAGDNQEPHNQGQDIGNTDYRPNVKAASKHDWFKKPERPPTPDSNWNEYPIDLSKPLPLIMVQGCQVLPADYFINNDLEYQREGSLSKKYTTSTTKAWDAKYDIPGIKDMVPSL